MVEQMKMNGVNFNDKLFCFTEYKYQLKLYKICEYYNNQNISHAVYLPSLAQKHADLFKIPVYGGGYNSVYYQLI